MGESTKHGKSATERRRLDGSRSYVADIWEIEKPATSRPTRKRD